MNKERSYFNIFLKIYFFVSLVVLFFLSVLFFNTGYWNQYKDPFLNRLYKSSVNHYLNIFEIGFYSLRGQFYKIPKLNISINFDNMLILENDRKNAAKEAGGGIHYNFSEVSSRINYKNKSYRADLRLKGDRKIHFEEEKYSSYKIDLKKENRILSAKKFSLMKPRARNYIHEWIFHELAGEGGLVKLKYEFVDLKINGNNKGLYVFEEGFGKPLLERNKRKNGPILAIHDEFSTDIKKAKLQVYNKKYWLNQENIELSKTASQKLRDFFDDKISSDEIFDMDKWAWFYAIADINDYFHALVLGNLKFYYNPAINKFEPIPFDGHRLIQNYSKHYDWNNLIWQRGPSAFEIAKSCKRFEDNNYTIIKKNVKDGVWLTKEQSEIDNIRCPQGFKYNMYKIFYNQEGDINLNFYKKYRNAVLKISSKDFLDSFFKKREKQIKKINSKIYGDYFFVDHHNYFGPGLYYFTEKNFYHKADLLLKLFIHEPGKIFIQQDKKNIIIQTESINNNNLVIKKLYCNDDALEEIILNVDYELIDKNKKINLANYININTNISCKKALLIDQKNNYKFSKTIDTLNNIERVNNNDS